MKPTTTDDVLDLMNAYFVSAALGVALESGLFWLLKETPLDADGVSQTLNIPNHRCRYWLDMLCDTGLLQQTPDGYAPSELGRTAILDAYSQTTWSFLARESRERFPVVAGLLEHIQTPGSLWDAQGLHPPDYMANLRNSSERARQFTRMLCELHRPMADEVARLLNLDGVRRMMDLGGGSGVFSWALLERHPQLHSVVVDIANVCEVGRALAADHPAAERIRYHAADFLQDELPGPVDLVLECDVGVYEEDLFAKLRAALNAEGRVVIVDQFAPAPGVAPPHRLLWAFQGSLIQPDKALPTADEVEAKLARAGFRHFARHPLNVGQVRRWTNAWMVIEARV